MRKLYFMFASLALLAGLALSSCSKDDPVSNAPTTEQQPGGDPGQQPDNPQPPAPVNAKYTGMVTDANGSPLRGVTVVSGTKTAKTDANGIYALEEVNKVNNRVVISFSKNGYMDVVRSIPFEETARIDVVMQSTYTANFTATTPHSVQVGTWGSSKQVKIELPAGYVDEKGAAYTGTVSAKCTYLSPDDANTFSQSMPGDLSAVNQNSEEVQLVSYGMVAVNLTGSDGQKLKMADGQKAKLTFPVPDKFAGETNRPSIPLWSFNESTGIWEWEGEATYDSNLNAYVGEVSHFSWHNLDWPEYRATLKISVKNANGDALANVPVDVDGERMVYTNSAGIATCTVPCNTPLDVRIPSESYGNYAPEKKQTNITLSAGEEKTISFVMPKLPVIKGTVVNEGNGMKICKVSLVYGTGQSTQSVMSDIFGAFSLTAPADYKGLAVLTATATDGTSVSKNIELTGEDLTVTLTINTKSGLTGNGKIVLTNGAGTKSEFTVPGADENELFAGATLVGTNLEVQLMSEPDGDFEGEGQHPVFGGIHLYLDNYSTTQTSYDQVHMDYRMEGAGWMEISMTGHLDVTLNNGVLSFKFSGTAQVHDGDWSKEPEQVNATAEFTAPLTFRGHGVTSTTDKTLMPTFTPYLNGKSFNGLIIDECKLLGQGGMIYYPDATLTLDDYNTLVTAAKATFGNPYAVRQAGGEYESQPGFTRFFKNNQFLDVTFNPSYQEGNQGRDGYYSTWDLQSTSRGRIVIRAFSNLQAPITSIAW